MDAKNSRNPPADDTINEEASFCSFDSACGGDADSQAVPKDEDSDSTDSDCAMDQPSLLEQLKTILDNYQDAQIIRELIQNADDANATEMQIIYVNDTEETTSGQYKQCGCYSEYFKVPALCVYNNAMFDKDDWKYIKTIYRSGKREDALKIGRFGLGFKSVFHMTDNPVIISGDKLLIIDPFRTKNKLGNDCHTLKFKKLQKTVQKKRHYKQAVVAMETLYGHCGFTKESLKDGYHGTLFWFPLRRSASKLSTKVFDHRDVKELIAMFKKEAPCLPLFLKNITQVSFHNKDEISSSFSVTCSVSEQEEKASFHIKLAACKGRSPDDDIKAIFPVNVTVKDGKEVKTQRWFVCNYVKGLNSLSGELRTLIENKLSYSPFVGIAVPIDNTSDAKFHGHVFCFLPLPSTGENYTGLPVHINGFFALSQDRHHVKWPTDDQTEREDEAQRWNRFLCEEVIVDAYTDTLDYMKKLTVRQNCMESDNLVYNILPSRPNVRPNWNTIVDPLYSSLKSKDVFYTKNNGGKWVQSKDAIFSILKWNEDKSITVRETEQCIVDLLLDCQRNVVNVPSQVADMFPDVARITPKYLRNVMRERPIYTRYPSEHKLVLLQFILADRRYYDLSDLQLLPLEDETFRSFDNGYPKYICTKDEMKIFPGIEQNFVKLDIAQTILSHLNEMQTEGM
ncbi:Sacsin [Mizuhopecten yessoensis]|uniref:Sacsin n=1 Tax=Mizuhopecten yessoensis TaxID=6573 RepID=A0A210PWF3_MIZYE|nr:Sacsin [Mizuhopecten yessoensis]